MLSLVFRNRPEWTLEDLFLDFCEGHRLTYDAVVEANRQAEVATDGYIGGTLESSYRKFFDRELSKGYCHSSAHERAVLSVVRLALPTKER